ncbi:hypothetical protein Syun_020350 [Stephania yunnanensis]|uniref:Uncharacterized protein n=1 Tax=Stephania yunnanensis TaxID=152371 RepID=A0AAP0IEE8_9MAGN
MHFFPKLSCTIRHYTTLRKLPKLRKIPIKRRSQAILQAQQALMEYLHNTRSIPFTHAENITKNSLVSLSDLISEVDFSPQTFSVTFPGFLGYHPINEFEFFFESIGIPCSEIEGFFRPNEYIHMFTRSISLEYKHHGIDIECQAPLLVATRLSSIGKSTFWAPYPKAFARASVDRIGYEEIMCSPYWMHSLQWHVLDFVPTSIKDWLTLKIILNRRK